MKKFITTLCLLGIFIGGGIFPPPEDDTCVKDKGIECHCANCTYSPDWGGGDGDKE